MGIILRYNGNMGQPKKATKRKQAVMVNIRMTEEQARTLAFLAAEDGRTKSGYLRALIHTVLTDLSKSLSPALRSTPRGKAVLERARAQGLVI